MPRVYWRGPLLTVLRWPSLRAAQLIDKVPDEDDDMDEVDETDLDSITVRVSPSDLGEYQPHVDTA